MNKFIAAIVLLPLMPTASWAQTAGPTGDAAAGKAFWDSPAAFCKNCHGDNGEGAFGPDLAGRGLSVSEFRQAVRKPWGIMPAFIDAQVDDRQIANLTAYFASLPKNDAPGKWRFETPTGASPGLAALINLGCAQCHTPTFQGPRRAFGATHGDLDSFMDFVYNHTTAEPKYRAAVGDDPNAAMGMGNFNPYRVSEASLRQIYDWARDEIGFRVPLVGQIGAPIPGATGVVYKVNVTNIGLPGKGLTGEGVTIRLIVPKDSAVVSATGDGYQGVRMDAAAKANVAEWTVPKMAAKDQVNYTITLSKAGTAADNLRGTMRWAKPAPKSGMADVANIPAAPLLK